MGFYNVQDKMLDFGSVNLVSGLTSGAATFPNVLEIGKADVNRMQAGFSFGTVPAGGTAITFSLEGSNDNSTYVEIAAVTGSLTKSTFIAFPRDTFYKYLRAKVKASTGTFTAGVVNAAIDTYVGK